MKSLNENLTRFTWGLGAFCGLNMLIALLLFLRGSAILGMYAATFLVFLIPVTVGFLLFKNEIDNIVNMLQSSAENPPPDQSQYSYPTD